VKRSAFLLSVACAALFTACTQPPPSPPAHDAKADEAAIRAGTETFLKAYNAGDAKSATADDADDIVQMRPDGPELVGKPANVEAQEKEFAENTFVQTATVDEIAVWGDVGMSRGTWQVTATPKTGKAKPVSTHGKWIVIHKRAANGRWMSWRHMWNEDRSTAKPAAK
jgi:ketosteroid isomerase-like protein